VSDERPAVFLDRDGTLNVERDLVESPSDLELIEGVGEALSDLHAAGYALVVVTNQSARARGLLSEAGLEAIHRHLRELLWQEGVVLTDVLHCPHHPTQGEAPLRAECTCRKPKPGMLLEAASKHALDLSHSWIVGDSARDIEAGQAAGIRTLLVETGKGREERTRCSPDAVVADLRAAAAAILATS